MAETVDKRRRNARASKYRPRTDAQKARRRDLWAARADERRARRTSDGEAALLGRLAELIDAANAGDQTLIATVLDVLDRRVDAVRDRLTVRELLGGAPLPLRPGGSLEEAAEEALRQASATAPDFDAMAHTAMAEEPRLRPSDIDADYADLDGEWAPES